MNINEFIMKHRINLLENRKNITNIRVYQTPRIVCADGFNFSVQASKYHYCSPRTDEGPYTAFEVGFTSERCEELMPFAETSSNLTETVYAWVPAEVVEEVIRKHGGIVVPIKQ